MKRGGGGGGGGGGARDGGGGGGGRREDIVNNEYGVRRGGGRGGKDGSNADVVISSIQHLIIHKKLWEHEDEAKCVNTYTHPPKNEKNHIIWGANISGRGLLTVD